MITTFKKAKLIHSVIHWASNLFFSVVTLLYDDVVNFKFILV